jgi:putative oxidoreductase
MSAPSNVRQWLGLIGRVVAGGLLCAAGLMKLNTPAAFAETIANFRLLPPVGNQLLAVALPWCELSAGLMLIAGVWTRAAGIAGLLLFLAFGIAVSAALMRGLDIECGCFGTATGARVGLMTLGIDIAGLVASAISIIGSAKASVRFVDQ